MAILNPSEVRLSPHFLLSDFMGCNSVYSYGLPNVFDKQGLDRRLDNAKALCEEALEPVLAAAGPISISYGFISPELSREIVTYQSPDKPSHHRWDLGAAADICVHDWVQPIASQAGSTTGAPIEFALSRMSRYPLSRLISYSESPYLCVAVSAEEVEKGKPRHAWYENRYMGKAKVKPDYRKYGSDGLRERALHDLMQDGLEHPWQGAGYPTYHGGGTRQYQHRRTSRYTMLSDWLYDEHFVRTGIRNEPQLLNALAAEAFQLAGFAYDEIIRISGFPRFSIVSAYTSPFSKGWIEGRDWRGDTIEFELVAPGYTGAKEIVTWLRAWPEQLDFLEVQLDRDRLVIRVDRENAKNAKRLADQSAQRGARTRPRRG